MRLVVLPEIFSIQFDNIAVYDLGENRLDYLHEAPIHIVFILLMQNDLHSIDCVGSEIGQLQGQDRGGWR